MACRAAGRGSGGWTDGADGRRASGVGRSCTRQYMSCSVALAGPALFSELWHERVTWEKRVRTLSARVEQFLRRSRHVAIFFGNARSARLRPGSTPSQWPWVTSMSAPRYRSPKPTLLSAGWPSARAGQRTGLSRHARPAHTTMRAHGYALPPWPCCTVRAPGASPSSLRRLPAQQLAQQ